VPTDGEALRALQVKRKVSAELRLSEWGAVWDFQQAALNSTYAHDEEGLVHYISPELISGGVQPRVLKI
jgi:hypothetical protein